MKKEKENYDSIAIALQTTKLTVTMHDKCLVKVENALNL
jgi:hypothetical protein